MMDDDGYAVWEPTSNAEECWCSWCGYPFDGGDSVYWQDGRPYCGPHCSGCDEGQRDAYQLDTRASA